MLVMNFPLAVMIYQWIHLDPMVYKKQYPSKWPYLIPLAMWELRYLANAIIGFMPFEDEYKRDIKSEMSHNVMSQFATQCKLSVLNQDRDGDIMVSCWKASSIIAEGIDYRWRKAPDRKVFSGLDLVSYRYLALGIAASLIGLCTTLSVLVPTMSGIGPLQYVPSGTISKEVFACQLCCLGYCAGLYLFFMFLIGVTDKQPCNPNIIGSNSCPASEVEDLWQKTPSEHQGNTVETSRPLNARHFL